MDQSSSPNVKRRTISDQVFDYLRAGILEGEIPAGSRIKEADVAEELSVSRTPVREAVRMLEAEGLIDRLSNGHTIVAPRSLRDMIEAFEVRIALESYSARLAAERATEDQIDRLEAVVMASSKETSAQFHDNLLDIAGNRRLADQIEDINDYIKIYRHRLNSTSKNLGDEIVSHEEIFLAVQKHDGPKAQSLMEQHLTQALEVLRSLWAEG